MLRTPPTHSPAAQQTINMQSSKRNRNEVSPGIETENPAPSTGLSQIELIHLNSSTINSNLDEKLKTLSTKKDIDEIKTGIFIISSEMKQLTAENQKLKEELKNVRRECEGNKKDLLWMKEQIKSYKIFIKGLSCSNEPLLEVNNILLNKLELSTKAKSCRKIQERNGKMSAVVEFATGQETEDVIRNSRKLVGSNIYLDRDLEPSKQQLKRVTLCLKTKIMERSKEHRITVKEDRIRIKDTWFSWNRERKLIAGINSAEEELQKIYGDNITWIKVTNICSLKHHQKN